VSKAVKEKNVKSEVCLDFMTYVIENYPLHLHLIVFDEHFINATFLNMRNKRTSGLVFKMILYLILHARDLLQI